MVAVERYIGATLKKILMCIGSWFEKPATSPNLCSHKLTQIMSVFNLPTWQNIILDSRHRMKLCKNMSSCCAKEVLNGEENNRLIAS